MNNEDITGIIEKHVRDKGLYTTKRYSSMETEKRNLKPQGQPAREREYEKFQQEYWIEAEERNEEWNKYIEEYSKEVD